MRILLNNDIETNTVTYIRSGHKRSVVSMGTHQFFTIFYQVQLAYKYRAGMVTLGSMYEPT